MSIISVWKRQTRNWKIVSIRSMFSRFFTNLTLAYDSIYIRYLGANPIQLGMVNSISHLAGTLISAPFGWLQDRYSLRKIFLVGIIIHLVSRYMFASAGDWFMIIPAMFLTTLALRVGHCLTICDVSLKDEDRSTCKGICDGLFFTLSLFAPTAAALIITYFGGINVEGIRPLYWIQLGAGVLLFIFLAVQLKEIERTKLDRSSGFIKDYREVFERGTHLKRWILFSAVNQFSIGLTTPFTPLFAHEMKGANQFILGGMITAGHLIQVLFSTTVGGMADRVGRKKVIYAMEPLYWASILMLVFAPSQVFLLLSSVLGGFRIIANFVAVTPLMVNRVPIDCIGRWRGIIGVFNGVVSIAAPIVGGYIWEAVGPSYLFFIPIVVNILIKIPLLMTIPERERTE